MFDDKTWSWRRVRGSFPPAVETVLPGPRHRGGPITTCVANGVAGDGVRHDTDHDAPRTPRTRTGTTATLSQVHPPVTHHTHTGQGSLSCGLPCFGGGEPVPIFPGLSRRRRQVSHPFDSVSSESRTHNPDLWTVLPSGFPATTHPCTPVEP